MNITINFQGWTRWCSGNWQVLTIMTV